MSTSGVQNDRSDPKPRLMLMDATPGNHAYLTRWPRSCIPFFRLSTSMMHDTGPCVCCMVPGTTFDRNCLKLTQPLPAACDGNATGRETTRSTHRTEIPDWSFSVSLLMEMCPSTRGSLEVHSCKSENPFPEPGGADHEAPANQPSEMFEI